MRVEAAVAGLHYFVTRAPNRGFVILATLDEIRVGIDTGRLQPGLYATESDGRSFSQFSETGDRARWRTLTELLAEAPPPDVPEPAPSPGPSRQLSAHFTGGAVSWLLLVAGQLMAALVCVAAPIGVVYQLSQLSAAEKVIERAGRGGDHEAGPAAAAAVARVSVVVAGVLVFGLNAALFVVFKRANSLAQLAADQDAENRQVRQAIADLNSRTSPPGSDRTDAESDRSPSGDGS